MRIAPAPEVQLFEALWQVYNGNSTQGMKKLVSLEILVDQGQITHSFVELLWMKLAMRNYEQTELFFKSSEFCVERQEHFLKKLTALKEKASSKNTKFSNTMVQKFQIVKISGTSYHHVDHSDVILLDFCPFSRDFSPVSFNGYTVFPRFAEGRRSGTDRASGFSG